MVSKEYLLLLMAAWQAHQVLSFSVSPSSLATLTSRTAQSIHTAPLRRSDTPHHHHGSVCMTSSVGSLSFAEDEDVPTSTVLMSATNDNQQQEPNPGSLRSRMRQATGFSLTAFRATWRAATGISLTAVYASALAATSAFVRKTMAAILTPLPPWFRYFLQPFLILYYTPLIILRNLCGPTGRRARETHEVFVDGFKSAVDAAERKADGYWPVHVTEEGDIVSVPQQSAKEVDVNEGIAKSIEAIREEEDNAKA